ncbi:hypothetical protein [Pseudomonas sp. IAC-BECa141]|uniref:hypothetical protein n=1 Tax=Pseudomonas sp. IAC-BECa141 TaxID=2793103 RepID=UPI001D06711C|nr:hypothetical protein [Pseudomonas sp. IAC-BECa141]UDI95293.1 hypothetical protein I5961_12595 [Pseudomonas sp. IAC-BECa141]
MGKIKIERLTVSSGSSLATYDREKSTEELFLEDTDELNVYKVTLREGTYGHTGEVRAQGEFEVDLSIGGSMHGHVVAQLLGRTQDGEPETIILTLEAER